MTISTIEDFSLTDANEYYMEESILSLKEKLKKLQQTIDELPKPIAVRKHNQYLKLSSEKQDELSKSELLFTNIQTKMRNLKLLIPDASKTKNLSSINDLCNTFSKNEQEINTFINDYLSLEKIFSKSLKSNVKQQKKYSKTYNHHSKSFSWKLFLSLLFFIGGIITMIIFKKNHSHVHLDEEKFAIVVAVIGAIIGIVGGFAGVCIGALIGAIVGFLLAALVGFLMNTIAGIVIIVVLLFLIGLGIGALIDNR